MSSTAQPIQQLEHMLARQQADFAAVLQQYPELEAVLTQQTEALAAEPTASAADQFQAGQPSLATVPPVLLKLWIASDYAAGLCITEPLLLTDLLRTGDLQRKYTGWSEHLTAFLSRLPPPVTTDPMTVLRRGLRKYRKREMLRIIWRDVLGLSTLMETCHDLSRLADACVQHALAELTTLCRQQHGMALDYLGREQQMIVLAMGKYGACELNMSSDIDLILAYPENGETTITPLWQEQYPDARSTTIQQYFCKLGQLLNNVLDAVTSDGFVFRVDMRLRPHGDSGALALSINAMEEYYQVHGRDWERFAMIKVRAVTGDWQLRAKLIGILHAFSYRRYLDFATIEALRDLKLQIEQQVRRKSMHSNIKLGSGGIREIEFIVQVLQLIYGGRSTHLQTSSILEALEGLVLERYMQAEDAAALRESYFFLRRLEHAIQALEDRQTHAYPQDATSELRIALALNMDSPEQLREHLAQVRALVASNFADLIAAPAADVPIAPDDGMREIWQGRMDQDKAQAILAERGYKDAGAVLQSLKAYRSSKQYMGLDKNGRERMDRFMPLLLSRLANERQHDPDLGFQRLFNFVQSVAKRTAYLVLLIENPVALSQLIMLCSGSSWLAELLSRYPVLLDELLRPLSQPPDKAQLQDLLRQQLLRSPGDALDEQLANLQNFRQEQVLTVAAAELARTMPLMKISDYLTWVAEVVLAHVLEMAWQQLLARYGHPFNSDGKSGEQDFVVIGYGKLGGIELNYGSDLDLVFMHDGHADMDTTGGSSGSVNSGAFYIQLGQKVLSLLSTHTLTGKLYEIDMRLRPSGASGSLVSSRAAFLRYQLENAWTWEHQALVRARVVAGSPTLAADFDDMRRQILGAARDHSALAQDIVSMRERMRRQLGSRQQDKTFHLKQDAGGLVDIEFIVQYLVLAFAHEHARLLAWTDNMRLLDAAAATGVLPAGDAARLQEIYIDYRLHLHRLALDKSAYLLSPDTFNEQRQQVIAIWDALFADVPATVDAGKGAPELS